MADKWHQKLDVRNPERKIGETPDGQPIWMDLRELISSPDDEAARMAATVENRRTKLINDVAHLVLKNAALFIEQTFWNTANQTGKRLYESGNAKAAFKWVSAAGFETLQDGLVTVVKHNGKVIRDMQANIPVGISEAVAARVKEIVRQQPITQNG